jgi:hypothetical protein
MNDTNEMNLQKRIAQHGALMTALDNSSFLTHENRNLLLRFAVYIPEAFFTQAAYMLNDYVGAELHTVEEPLRNDNAVVVMDAMQRLVKAKSDYARVIAAFEAANPLGFSMELVRVVQTSG